MTDLPQAVYRYWVCDLRTGNKIAQLPLKPNGALPDRIGDVSTTVFTCDQAAVLRDGGDFLGVTTAGRTVVVVEREYEGDSVSDILWAGIVSARKSGSGAEATLNSATVAAYLGRRFVGTHTYIDTVPGDTDEQIIFDLMTDAATEGVPFVLDVDCPTPRSVNYLEPEHKSVLKALQELSDMEGGPEWTIATRWKTTERLGVEHVLVARPRLGWAGAPNIRFDFPGCINSYDVDDDYTEGHGANHIRGVDSNGAASDPARDVQGITMQGWARWEDIVPTQDLDAAGLLGVAKEALTKRARGQSSTNIVVSLSAGPQYGRDWTLGDNATFFVAGPEEPGADSPSPRHPDGHEETIRVIGVAIDIAGDTLTPVLWNPYDEETTA